MSNLTLQDFESKSPFDSIRRVNDEGQEYWSARELMRVLGYDKWQNFNKNIKRAYISCQNSYNDATTHFLLRSVSSQGRSADDWNLSRLACYLVAMNGDPSKVEIANAQSYFAIKAREAEVIVPQQSDHIRELELELKVHEARLRADKSENELMNLKIGLRHSDPVTYQLVVEKKPLSEIVALLPAGQVEIRTPQSEDGISLTQLMGDLGCFERTKSGAFKQKDRDQVKQLLLEIGIDLSTGRGASKVEDIITRYAIPPEKIIDAKSRILNVVKQINPNIYESAMNRYTETA